MACVARCVAVVAVATAACCCWCYVCFYCSCCRLTHGPTFVRNDSWPTVCVVCCRHRRACRVADLVSRRWRVVVRLVFAPAVPPSHYGECRSYCRCFVGEGVVSVRVQLSYVSIRFCSVVSDSRRHCKSAPSVCLRVAVRVLFLRRGCVVPLAIHAALRRVYVQPRTGVTCARYSSRCGI